MSGAPRVHVSAMEGKGAYNRNAAISASGGPCDTALRKGGAADPSRFRRSTHRHRGLRVFPGKKLARADARRNRGPTYARRSATADFRMPHRPPGQRLQRNVCAAGERPGKLSAGRTASLSVCNRPLVLSKPVPAGSRRSRMEFLRCRLAQPGSPTDPGPLLHSLLNWRGPGRVRSTSGTGLGGIPDPAGSRVASWRPFGCRAACARSRCNDRVRFDDESCERRTL